MGRPTPPSWRTNWRAPTKKGGSFASSSVGGLSGAFVAVSEDAALARAVEAGDLTIAKFEAMTTVCSVGLDYDRRSRRDRCRDPRRPDRRRGRHRRDQPQDDRRAGHSPLGQRCWQPRRLRRPLLARLPSSPSAPRAARCLSSVTAAASPHRFPAFEIKKTKKPLEEMRKVVTLFAIQTHRTRLHGQHPKHQRRMES